jgi:hypothetical protein
MPNRENTLEIYLQYEDYLTAGQLRDLLGHMDRLYDALYSGMTHFDHRQMGLLQSRLRVSEMHTGNSITLLLTAGIATMMKGGVIVTVPAAIGALSVAAKLLTSAAKGAVELRKTWHEGTKAKYEAELARKQLHEHEKETHVPEPDVRTIPDEAKMAAVNSAIQIVNLIEYSPNIVCFKVNGETVVTKKETEKKKE